jgi:glucosamine--fructose-6-phosphate aminotransferase (isomerizing)
MTKGQLMAGEMAEQPDVLARLVERAAEVRATGAEVVPVDLAACAIVARGSSDHAALLGQYLLEVATGRPVALASPSLQTLYRAPVDYRGVLVVGVSQSGATSEIVEVVAVLRAAGARTIAITNDPSSPLAEAAGSVIDLGAGPELAVPATKTVTATLLAFVLLAEGVSGRSLVSVLGPGRPATDWLGLIELGALEAAGMGADGRQGVERLRSPVKGPCEIKAR